MHEYSIVASLIDRVGREMAAHRASRVNRLHVQIGELSGVEIELLKTAFETFRERSVCGEAELCIDPVPAVWACPRCGREMPRGSVLRCSDCGVPARLTRGDEIILARIEMETADV